MLLSPPRILENTRWRNLRVGLLGGSFNPPHEGHLHISRIALQALRLDAVWWLVTPRNPLKSSEELAPFEDRISLCREILRHESRIVPSDVERHLGCNRTFETVSALRKAYPQTEFVFITGTDNALGFHKWYRWRDILKVVSTAHIIRPPAEDLVRHCPLRQTGGQNHISLKGGLKVDLSPGNTYWVVQAPAQNISSSELRKLN